MTERERNLLLELWEKTKNKLPDCRTCFPHQRTHVKKEKELRVCLGTRLLFWNIKQEYNKIKKN